MKLHEKKTMWDLEACYLAERETEEREQATQKYVTEDWDGAGVFWTS
jgi:hypothetical protein